MTHLGYDRLAPVNDDLKHAMPELIRRHGPFQMLAAFHEESIRYNMRVRSAMAEAVCKGPARSRPRRHERGHRARPISGIIERLERDGRFPMVIFENVKGSRFPLVANMHASFERLRLGLGMKQGGVKDFVRECGPRQAP